MIYRAVQITLLCVIFIFSGCGSPRPPDWKIYSVDYIAMYQKSFLSGDDDDAAIYFDKAIAYIKDSGRTALLKKAWMVRCALEHATFTDSDCDYLRRFDGIDDSDADDAYTKFITGKNVSDISLLPEQYRNIAKDMSRSSNAVNDAIKTIENPLSIILISSIAIRHGTYNKHTILHAIDTASEQGWKRAVTVFMGIHADWLEAHGESEHAALVRKKIRLITENK